MKNVLFDHGSDHSGGFVRKSATEKEESESEADSQRRRRTCWRIAVVVFGLSLLVGGVAGVVGIVDYFSTAEAICSIPSEQIMARHPELRLWRHCSFQV